jgi:AraC-like DNA-binding protein
MSVIRIPHVSLDSNDVAPHERLEYWQASLDRVCELSFPDRAKAPFFRAHTDIWLIGNTLVSRRDCGPHSLTRSRQAIRRDFLDHYKIHFRVNQSAGASIHCGNQSIEVAAGECVISDMSQPETLHVADGTSIVVIVPREALDPMLARPMNLNGTVLRGPLSVLLGSHLNVLTTHIPQVQPEQTSDINKATLALLSASLAPLSDALDVARPAVDATLARMIRVHINSNLLTPELSSDSICCHFRISRATLYRLFEPAGGVMKHIKSQRLRRVHQLLLTNETRARVGDIARDYGFNSPQHFSRSFREEFGYSPTEVADGARATPRASTFHSEQHMYSLARWLHGIQQ